MPPALSMNMLTEQACSLGTSLSKPSALFSRSAGIADKIRCPPSGSKNPCDFPEVPASTFTKKHAAGNPELNGDEDYPSKSGDPEIISLHEESASRARSTSPVKTAPRDATSFALHNFKHNCATSRAYATLLRVHGIKGEAPEGASIDDLRVFARLVTSLPKDLSFGVSS